MNHGRFITIDTEARNVSDIDVGPAKYWEDDFVEMLCACWSFGMDDEVFTWNCATEGIEESPFPRELFDKIEQGWVVEAHNMMFERRGFEFMTRKRGWPKIPVTQLRCSAAKAAYNALPRSLEALCLTLQTKMRKDPVGKDLIKALAHPTIINVPKERTRKGKETKAEAAWRIAHEEMGLAESVGDKPKHFWLPDGRLALWNEDPTLIRRNWEYCRQDVRTEKECSLEMPDMPEKELEVWRMDQEMNYRGIKIDKELCEAAIEMADDESEDLKAELNWMVGVKCTRPAVHAFLEKRMGIPNLQKETVDLHLARLKDVTPDQKDRWLNKEVLELYRKVSRSSTAKYRKMLLCCCANGRVHDTLMYSGAHTTRWTGKGVQPHNYPRGAIKYMDVATAVIKERDRDWARFLYGDVMLLLSHSLRGAIVAPEGRTFWVADYAAVEARVVFWLSQCKTALAVFELLDTDIYCDLAEKIYGYPINKHQHPTERQFGKQGILGLGFGMGFCKFLITCRKYGIKFSPEQVMKILGRDKAIELANWIKTPGPRGGFNQVRRAELGNVKDAHKKYKRGEPLEFNELFKKNLHELVLSKYVVDLYRSQYEEVPIFWKAQEKAAVAAVKGQTRVECGLITWEFLPGRIAQLNRLVARLPSGRVQTYWNPETRDEKKHDVYKARMKAQREAAKLAGLNVDLIGDQEDDFGAAALSYWEVDEKTMDLVPTHTYGGKITENLVQHVARDLMADAMVRIEVHPTYENVLTVHDEGVAESGAGDGDKKEFGELLSRGDPWSDGCPIDAEVWTGPQYKKA